MNVTQQVEQWIREAARMADAEVFTPTQWDTDDSAWALVRRADRRIVLTVEADYLAQSAENGTMWNDVVVVNAYASERDVMAAEDVMQAVRAEDGSSVDPQGYAEGSLDFLAGTIAQSIVDAMTGAADHVRDEVKLREEVAAELPDGLSADIISTWGERHVAVLVSDSSDVATIVRHDGRVFVEGIGEDNDNHEFDTVADAVRAVLAAR